LNTGVSAGFAGSGAVGTGLDCGALRLRGAACAVVAAKARAAAMRMCERMSASPVLFVTETVPQSRSHECEKDHTDELYTRTNSPLDAKVDAMVLGSIIELVVRSLEDIRGRQQPHAIDVRTKREHSFDANFATDFSRRR
jgi:hypothetical protein